MTHNYENYYAKQEEVYGPLIKKHGLKWSHKPNEPYRTGLGVPDLGWFPLIEKLVEDLIALGWDREVAQIKEKFGGLRFYIGSGTQAIFERISKAEEESYTICETCGEPGKLRGGGWLKTLCDGHGAGKPVVETEPPKPWKIYLPNEGVADKPALDAKGLKISIGDPEEKK
jgi:hypothetical protein